MRITSVGCAGEVVREVVCGAVRKVVRWACAQLCGQHRMVVNLCRWLSAGVVRRGCAADACHYPSAQAKNVVRARPRNLLRLRGRRISV